MLYDQKMKKKKKKGYKRGREACYDWGCSCCRSTRVLAAVINVKEIDH